MITCLETGGYGWSSYIVIVNIKGNSCSMGEPDDWTNDWTGYLAGIR